MQEPYIKTVSAVDIIAAADNGACSSVHHHGKAPFHCRKRAACLKYCKGQFMPFTKARDQA
jgi:hypothetical protein